MAYHMGTGAEGLHCHLTVMTTMKKALPYPQWRAIRVTNWMGKTRWAAYNGCVYCHPEVVGKDHAKRLAIDLTAQERADYRRFLAYGTD